MHDGFPLLASSFESTAEEWNPAHQNHPVRCGIVTLHVRREPLDSLRDEKEQREVASSVHAQLEVSRSHGPATQNDLAPKQHVVDRRAPGAPLISFASPTA